MGSKAYLGAIVLLAAFASMGAELEPKAFVQCLERLIPCGAYVQKPELPESCCNVLRAMLDSNVPCLCAVYNSPSILMKINTTRESMSQLPLKCGRPAPYCEEPRVDSSKTVTPSSAALTSQVSVDIDALQAADQSMAGNTSGSGMLVINAIFLAACNILFYI